MLGTTDHKLIPHPIIRAEPSTRKVPGSGCRKGLILQSLQVVRFRSYRVERVLAGHQFLGNDNSAMSG